MRRSASLAKLNTCVEDSDCLLQGGDCPFGCYIPTHKDVQRSEIDALLKPWQDSSCRKCAYGCAAADKVACIGGRCEVIQPDLI